MFLVWENFNPSYQKKEVMPMAETDSASFLYIYIYMWEDESQSEIKRIGLIQHILNDVFWQTTMEYWLVGSITNKQHEIQFYGMNKMSDFLISFRVCSEGFQRRFFSGHDSHYRSEGSMRSENLDLRGSVDWCKHGKSTEIHVRMDQNVWKLLPRSVRVSDAFVS